MKAPTADGWQVVRCDEFGGAESRPPTERAPAAALVILEVHELPVFRSHSPGVDVCAHEQEATQAWS
jgi:hypothetical protein